MSFDTDSSIPLQFKLLRTTRPSMAAPLAVSENQRGFAPLLDRSLGGADPTALALRQLDDNPDIAKLMVANGGYGLQAFVQSLGLMDVDGSLGEACRHILTMSQPQAYSSPVRTQALRPLEWGARPDMATSPFRRSRAASATGEECADSDSAVSPEERRILEATLFEPLAGQTRGANHAPHSGQVSEGRERQQTVAAQDDCADFSELSAQFESGALGAAAVGYDRTGGTSYGLYQIASKTGTMDSFLGFLDSAAPDIAKRLRAAGPADTGSKEGAMPDAWRAIANQSPKRFADLQRDFIRQSHFDPAARGVLERTGVDPREMSQAVQEVLWSTAVQHGATGAARLFERAVDKAGPDTAEGFEARLIEQVYDERATQFGSSTKRVQAAVDNRFRAEKQLALLMLQTEQA